MSFSLVLSQGLFAQNNNKIAPKTEIYYSGSSSTNDIQSLTKEQPKQTKFTAEKQKLLNQLEEARTSNDISKKEQIAKIKDLIEMEEQKWSDAAVTYKTIIDFNCYSIDPKYRELFLGDHELSKEIIMSSQYLKDTYGQVLLIYLTPEAWGGWHQFSPFNELVKEYECTDGKTIDVSPLYDKNNPYNNRDPRLDATIFIPERTVFRGTIYTTNPTSGNNDKFGKYPVWSGYSILKFMEDDPSVSVWSSGTNWIMIRYAEVLLGYLESKLESGATIDQALLDQTVNKVRGRAAVNMPPVITTNPDDLRKIVRRERRVEFAFEGIRYYDILRWGIAADELNHQFTGQKLTNDPASYTAYPVDADGYYIMSQQKRAFIAGKNELWPIPQSERDINKNLTQNTGY